MVEKSIIDDIKKEFMPWQKVRIVRQYDPDVIQGYIVDFGDKILDKSYGSKLRKMKNALSGLDA
jgi:F0F1-type ATP synthase delta subunit